MSWYITTRVIRTTQRGIRGSYVVQLVTDVKLPNFDPSPIEMNSAPDLLLCDRFYIKLPSESLSHLWQYITRTESDPAY